MEMNTVYMELMEDPVSILRGVADTRACEHKPVSIDFFERAF